MSPLGCAVVERGKGNASEASGASETAVVGGCLNGMEVRGFLDDLALGDRVGWPRSIRR